MRASQWIGFAAVMISVWLGGQPRSLTAAERPKLPLLLAQQALQDKLKDFPYWSNLCSLQADAGKYEEALKSCEQAIVLRPKEPTAWADHSAVLLRQKQYPEAIASADRALNFDRKTSLALTYKCMAFEALGRNEEALDYCNQALKVDGNWGRKSPALAWLHRGIILNQAGQLEQALTAFDRTLLLEPTESITLAYRCQVLSKLGKQQEAIATCDQSLQGNGNWGDQSAAFAWANRGLANRQLTQWQTAIADYDRAISIDPNNATIWTAQGLLLEKLARPTEALASYTRATEITPKYALALLGRCSMLNRLMQYKEAEEPCKQAIQGDGNWGEASAAQAWNQRSVALAGQGKYEEALAIANRSVGINPKDAIAWSDRSVPLWYLKQYDDAIASTQQAIRLDPTYAQPWFNQGTVLRSLGRYQEALAAYDQALQLAPTNSDGWANRSVTLWQLKRYPAAIAAADNAIRFNPNSFPGWYNRGTALLSLNAFQEAFAAYQRASQIDPKSSDALTGQGIALAKLKRFPDALAILQTSLQLNANQPLAQATLKTISVQLQKQKPTTQPTPALLTP